MRNPSSGWHFPQWTTVIKESAWSTLFPVVSSFATYSLILHLALESDANSQKKRSTVKWISASHAVFMTFGAVWALRFSSWTMPSMPSEVESNCETSNLLHSGSEAVLDDAANPIIAGRSTLANWLSGWETGYLIYDIVAMTQLQEEHSIVKATTRYAKTSPVFFAHHISLCAAFLYLQLYIARGKERGVWVITAFFLMYASNPLLHFGWWLRKRGSDAKNILFADLGFAILFAISRFGNVAVVLNAYGKYHSIGTLDAYRNLRKQCKAGTGLLLGLNGLWWLLFTRKLALRALSTQGRYLRKKP